MTAPNVTISLKEMIVLRRNTTNILQSSVASVEDRNLPTYTMLHRPQGPVLSSFGPHITFRVREMDFYKRVL